MPYKDPEKEKQSKYKYWLKHKDKYDKQRKERRWKNRKYVAELKEKSSCENCGESHPACLEFHHIDESTKIMTISKACLDMQLDGVKKEIAKCKIVCSNCHRKIHSQSGTWLFWEEYKKNRVVTVDVPKN